MSDVAVAILAGGEGTRIGGRKPLRMLAGERLIDRALRSARSWSDAVAIAVRAAGQLGKIDVSLVLDEASVHGPLGGLIAAMRFARDARREFVLTIPADMPFLPEDLLDRLHGAIGLQSCAMACSGGQLHPVCALWRASAVEDVDSYLRAGRRSLKGFAETVGFVAVEWPAEPSDPFFNINQAADLDLAARRASRSEL